ncbi:MAG: hypothetical protein ABIH90_01730 [Candidatus Aenigmatarchaeota archaeon]
MKGFMHVIEIVIISLLVIVVIAQLYRSVPSQSTWDRTQLEILAGDIIHSLDAKGVSWIRDDGLSAKGEVIRLLENTTIVFDLSIENLPNPRMFVGCICTDDEFNELSQMVTFSSPTKATTFFLNGLKYEVTLRQIYTGSEMPPTLEFPLIYDVIIICDDSPALEGSRGRLEKYLLQDRGVILLKDLTPADIIVDDTLLEVFGVEGNVNADPGQPTYKLTFQDNPESRYYNVRKYFLAIPNESGPLSSLELDSFVNETFVFTNFLDSDEKVWAFEGDENKELLQSTGEVPIAAASVVNENVYKDHGRTAWLSDGVSAGEEANKGVLIKSLILWASGERFKISESQIKRPETTYLIDVIKRVRYLDPSPEELVQQKTTFFHPIKVVLSLGYALK